MMAIVTANNPGSDCAPPPAPTAPRRGHSHLWIATVLLLALCLRLAVAARHPGIDWPDETYQTVEPAHHLVYGNWIKTWKYQHAARSWVFPAFLSLVMRGTSWLGSGSSGYLLGIRIILSLLSLLPIYFAIRWAERVGGRPAARIAACSAVTWYQLIYYAPKPLSEVAAADFLLPGLYLLVFAAHRKEKLFAGGLLCGLALALRLQLAPVVVTAVALLTFADLRVESSLKKIFRSTQLIWITLGVLLPLLLFGIVDAFTWSYPFQSYWENIRLNAALFRTNPFGKEPVFWYLTEIISGFSFFFLFVLLGALRAPFLGIIVLALVVPHSLIPHKELRFLAPVLPVLVLLGSIGLADVVNAWSNRRARSGLRSRLAVPAACLFCAGLSASLASHFPRWDSRVGPLTLFRALSQDSSACGVAVLPAAWWDRYGGYAYLHRNIPIYAIPQMRDAWRSRHAFNALATNQPLPSDFSGFSLSQCSHGVCLYRRPGTCTPQTAFELNALLRESPKPQGGLP